MERSTKKILIVDDDRQIAEMLRDRLEFNDEFEVEAAFSGNEGFRKAIRDIPDVMLLDLNMPEMDGYEVLQMIKNDSRARDIKVIIITVRDEKESVDKGIFLGAVEYLVKPVVFSELERLIKNYLSPSAAV